MIRTLTAGVMLLLLLCGLMVYFYYLSVGGLKLQDLRSLYQFTMAFYLLYLLIIFSAERNYYENTFLKVGLSVLLVFFITSAMHNLGYIQAYHILKCFVGLNIAITAMILISGGRHGIFKD